MSEVLANGEGSEWLGLDHHLAAQIDMLLGPIASEWQNHKYHVPATLVAKWNANPFREQMPNNLKFKVQVSSRWLDHPELGRLEKRSINLTSSYSVDNSDPQFKKNWSFGLDIDRNRVLLFAYEWAHKFTPESNSGHCSQDGWRGAIREDLEFFSKLLRGDNPGSFSKVA